MQSDELRAGTLPRHRPQRVSLRWPVPPLSQALFCLFPGQFTAWFVEFDDGGVHVFLRDEGGNVVDLVSYPDLLCDDET